MRTITFYVQGLYFEQSDVGLSRQLDGERGIHSVRVDSCAGVVEIAYDDSEISPVRICRVIRDCGYLVGEEATPV